MNLLWWIAGVVIGLFLLCIIIKISTRHKDDDDIISQGLRVGSKFNDCCIKKIKGMFGGGA